LTAAETARKTDSLQRTAFRLSRRKEKREAAITEIEKVLAVYNASKDPGDRLAAIDTLLNIGEVYTDLGNETDATKSFKLAFAKSQNRLERASTLTSVGDIYQEIVPNRAPAYDPLSPTSWSPYAIEFQPKERAISYYESALDVYDELRAELAAGTKIGNPAINDRDVDLLQAGIWVSLGLAKTELRNKRPDFGQATSSANQQQESFNEALRDIERGIYLYDLAGNHQGKGYALFALAEAKMRRGGISPENRKVVMEILRSSLAEYQTSSSLKGKIPVLKRMARVTLQPKEALDSMNEVVRIYTEFNDKPGTASALVELAEVLGQQPLDFGDVKARAARDNQKIQLYMEAADLYEKSDWFDKGAEALMTVSDLYSYESRFNARPVLERAAELYGKQERWGPQLSALRNLIGLSVSGPKPETKTYLNQMNEIAERRTKPEEKAAALERLGQAYIMVKDFEKADAVVKNALEQYRLAKDSYNQISILYRTASVYLERAQPDKAIEYLQQALSMGEKNWEGTLYSSLGEAYSRKSDPTKAIDFYVRAVQVFDGSKETYLQARSLLELGKLYSQESKFDLGVAALNKVIELNRSTDSYWEGGNAIMNLGALYEKKGDVKSAIDSYLRAVQLYEDKKAPNYYEVDPLLKISDVYAKIGDTKLAEEYKLRAKKLQTPIAQPTP
jgi:tetratricopeptide (TPR) repeat protein